MEVFSMNDTISDTLLFPACVKVLEAEVTPLHYGDLTHKALQSFNIDMQTINLNRQKEDVRERLLLAKRMGTFYTGQYLFLGALKKWFYEENYSLFASDNDYIAIGNMPITVAIDGAFEIVMRSDYMIDKFSRSPEKRYYAMSKGLMIEAAVKHFFRQTYPSMYAEPENAGNYKQPCEHDFRLHISGRRYIHIDVCGTNYKNEFRCPPQKKPTDFHLLCEIDEERLFLVSVAKGEDFRNDILSNELLFINQTIKPIQFICWLNCLKHGIDYMKIKRMVF